MLDLEPDVEHAPCSLSGGVSSVRKAGRTVQAFARANEAGSKRTEGSGGSFDAECGENEAA